MSKPDSAITQKAKERSRSGSHNESKHAYEAIQSLKHRNNEGTFCLEARIDSVKQIAGQPAITMLSDGEAKHSSIEAYLPFPISRQEDGRFWIRSEPFQGPPSIVIAEHNRLRYSVNTGEPGSHIML